MEILAKITMKTIDCQPAPRSVKEKTELAHIYGRAERVSEGSTTYGIFHKYKGNFEAVNLATGEVYRSGTLLLPEIADAILLQGLLAAGATLGKEKIGNTPGVEGERVQGDPVDFAVSIGVIPMESKDDTGRGYQFTVKPMMEVTAADPLKALRDHTASHRKALSGPASVQETPASSAAHTSAHEAQKATGTGGKRK